MEDVVSDSKLTPEGVATAKEFIAEFNAAVEMEAKANRRERIATAALQGLLASEWRRSPVSFAIEYADDLIAELDK
jgi:hypothetical protein